jgi:hypothetical protein
MPTKKDQLKAQLLKQYDTQLDKLLEQMDPHAELDLGEIEEAALAVRQKTGEDITQALAETQSQNSPPDLPCPTCSVPMRYKGKKPKQISSRSGEISIERAYYYCESCQRGVFPPG